MSSRAQIIATIGPASDSPEIIAALILAGMDVARINMSHGSHESNGASIERIQAAAKAAGKRVPIVLDLAGPRATGDGEHHFDAARAEITEKDLADLDFGLAHSVDYIAQSYVGNAQDIAALRAAIHARGARVPIIAKIERREGIEAFDEILAEADAIMVARGDLGNAIPIEDIPFVEKDLLARTRAAGKACIVATQMLLSMTEHAEPTRAEVTDVEYAIFLGADAVMLSEETALGKFPTESVATMERIVVRAERAGDTDIYTL